MKKVLSLLLCIALAFGMIPAVNAQTETDVLTWNAQKSENSINKTIFKDTQAVISYDELSVLDQMANSWIETCNANIIACEIGLGIYDIFGKPLDDYKEQLTSDLFNRIQSGSVQLSDVYFEIDHSTLCEELNDDSLMSYIDTFLNTSADAEDLQERILHNEANSYIIDKVKNGEIAENVDLIDIIKENYAFFIGQVGCATAIECFNQAKNATDLSIKRENMLSGALLATFGCEMSIENTDEILKIAKGRTAEEITKDLEKEIMVAIAEVGIDLVSEIKPTIGIAYDVITITADIGVKELAINGKVDAINGFIESPLTIDNNINDYFAAISNQYGLYTFEINNFEVTMKEYKGYLAIGDAYAKVVVPESIYGFPVTGFNGCFAEALSITEITIPSGVTSRTLTDVISNCDKLETVYYNTIACKGWYSGSFFYGCDSDFKVNIGPDVTVIPERFILSCGVSEVEFPESITTMYAASLKDCEKLKTVTIPSKVTQFEIPLTNPAGVIDNCQNLETVYYNAISANGSYYDGVLSNCGNYADEMSIEWGDNIKTIPSTFIKNCGVKSVVFPVETEQIREYAISECQRLETITIPSTITKFGDNLACDYVFTECDNLKTVNYNAKKATSYMVNIFDNIQSDFELNFGEEIEEIPNRFMNNCGIRLITFPDSLTKIPERALYGCTKLTRVDIPNSVTSIGDEAFTGCTGLTSIAIPDSVTSIRNYAFSYCSSLTLITFQGDAPNIGYCCFKKDTATAYYPKGNNTWTEDVRRDYGGIITWVPYDGIIPGDLDGIEGVTNSDVEYLLWHTLFP